MSWGDPDPVGGSYARLDYLVMHYSDEVVVIDDAVRFQCMRGSEPVFRGKGLAAAAQRGIYFVEYGTRPPGINLSTGAVSGLIFREPETPWEKAGVLYIRYADAEWKLRRWMKVLEAAVTSGPHSGIHSTFAGSSELFAEVQRHV